MVDALIRGRGLHKSYRAGGRRGRGGAVHAVDGIDLEVFEGETLAVVGESGSGKSTLGRLILGVEPPDAGEISRPARSAMQVVAQDPYSSLNPHRTALEIVVEPLAVRRRAQRGDEENARAALAAVGIEGDDVHKRPRSFSGGQRQRIAIARAIVARPAFILCDEPVSALDVSIQAQVTRLLLELQREFGLTYLFISHDLAVVRELATRVAVMRAGRIVEIAPVEEIFASPRHEYTRRLLDAVLVPDPPVARARLRHVAEELRHVAAERTGAPRHPKT